MKIKVRLNLYGNAILTKELNPPHAWEGMMINLDPSKPYDSLYNIRLQNITWIVNTDTYHADAFPFGGVPPEAGTEAQVQVLLAHGWKLRPKG